MGGITSAPVATPPTPAGPTLFLTRDKCDLLVQSWEDVQGVGTEQIGMRVFKAVFLASPESFALFPGFWYVFPNLVHTCTRTIIYRIPPDKYRVHV